MKQSVRADQARELIGQGRFTEAESCLHPALQHSPNDPDILCELCLIYCYTGREASAVRLFDRAQSGARFDLLGKLLLEHLTAKLQREEKSGRKDPRLMEMLFKVRRHFKGSHDAVGIRLSACLIVKDEEARLPECLASLKGLVDEIVVVDTGSTDHSVDIAIEHGAVVDHFAWVDDFAAARNHALDLATGDWVLTIDADERLTPESKQAILTAVTRPQFGGFAIPITSFTEDEGGQSTYVHCPVRLFRNLPGARYEGRIHEQIAPALRALRLPFDTLKDASILHEGYRPAVMIEKDKLARTVSLLEAEVLQHPRDPFHWFNLANALTAECKWQEAEHASRQACKFLEPACDYGTLAYQLLANALTQLDKPVKAVEACVEAESRGFGGILVWFERAQALLKAGDIEQALGAIETCLAAEWPVGLAGDYGIYTHKRHLVHGQILSLLGCCGEALEAFDRALGAAPGWGPALYCKAAILEKVNRLSEAFYVFQIGQQTPGIEQVCTKGAARVSASMGLQEQAADLYRSAWMADQTDQEAWIGWVAACEAQGNLRCVLAAYEAYAAVQQPSASVLVNWGRTLQSCGESDRALHCFSEAIKRDPGYANAYFNCGDSLYALGALADAAQMFETGLRLQPGHSEAWFVLANCLAKLGLKDSARSSYREALKINPGYQDALHNLELLDAA